MREITVTYRVDDEDYKNLQELGGLIYPKASPEEAFEVMMQLGSAGEIKSKIEALKRILAPRKEG